jgi:hypothetical protein
LELSWDQDAASADVSVPTLSEDGAIDGGMTAEGSAPAESPPSCQGRAGVARAPWRTSSEEYAFWS